MNKRRDFEKINVGLMPGKHYNDHISLLDFFHPFRISCTLDKNKFRSIKNKSSLRVNEY